MDKEIIKKDFDAINYVNNQFQGKNVTEGMVNNMIQNTQNYIDQIDEQIEKCIVSIQNIKLEEDSNLETLQDRIVDTNNKIQQILSENKQYIQELTELNDARANIDYITATINISLKFKTCVQNININVFNNENIENQDQINEQLMYLIQGQLLQQQIEQIKDTDQLRYSYNQFQQILTELQNKYDITQLQKADIIGQAQTFWLYAKNLLLLSLNSQNDVKNKIINTLIDTFLPELDTQQQQNQQIIGISNKLVSFIKINQAYIQDVEQHVFNVLQQQNDHIKDIYNSYYQEYTFQIQQLNIFDSLMQEINYKIQKVLQNDDINDTQIIQQNMKEVERLTTLFNFKFKDIQHQFVQVKDNIINQNNNDVADLINTQVEQLNQKAQDKTWLYNDINLFKYTQNLFIQLIQLTNKYPRQMILQQIQDIYNSIKQNVFDQFIQNLYELLDFQLFMPKQMKTYTKNVKNQHYKFVDIYKQQIQGLFISKSFQTQSMIIVDQSVQVNIDITNFVIQLCQISKLILQFFEQLLVQLNQLNTEEKLQDNDLEYEEYYVNYKYTVEQLLCQVIAGQYISIVFYSQNQSQQLIDVANNLFNKQIDVVTNELSKLYNEFDLQEIKYQIVSTLSEGIGGLLISKNYIRQKDVNQLQYLQKQIKQIIYQEEYKDIQDKLQITIQLVLISLQGQRIDKQQFMKLTQTELSQQLQYNEFI